MAKLFYLKKEEATKIASKEAIRVTKEIVEREFDLLEFNLFISSFGNKLTKATKEVEKLREKVDKGKVDLSKYEDMANEFV